MSAFDPELPRVINEALTTPAPLAVTRAMEGAGEWAISHDLAKVLWTLVRVLQPTSILEFGAGRSSLVIADALKGGRLTSVDHDASSSLAGECRDLLDRVDVAEHVRDVRERNDSRPAG